MSTDLKTKKRKSGDDVVPKAKKVKTAVTTTRATRSSAEKPAPLKSALKKDKSSKTTDATKPKESKKSSKASRQQEIANAEAIDAGVSDDEDGGEELTVDQTTSLLAGFSDTEDENSDAEGDEDAIEISKLPAPPTAGEVQKAISKIAKSSASDPESTPGVVYISRIPHGFYEPQMQAYFSQFGPIANIRLARNKKTGKSKHFAFIQFASASVAEIVAKTMDKYLLFGHLLQARVVPAEQVQENLWKGGKGVKGGKARPRNRIEGSQLRKGTDREGWEKRVEKEEKRRQEKAEKMKEMGYEFDLPSVKAVKAIPKKALKDVDAGAEKEPVVEESIVKKIEPTDDATIATVEKTTKRKGKGAAAATTVTKKRKTKVAA